MYILFRRNEHNLFNENLCFQKKLMHTHTVNLRMIYRRTLNIEYAIIRRSISNKDKIFLVTNRQDEKY